MLIRQYCRESSKLVVLWANLSQHLCPGTSGQKDPDYCNSRIIKYSTQNVSNKFTHTYNLVQVNKVVCSPKMVQPTWCPRKAVINPKHQKWFKLNTVTVDTRQKHPKFCEVIAQKERYKKSPLGYLTGLLNSEWTNMQFEFLLKWIIVAGDLTIPGCALVLSDVDVLCSLSLGK